MTGQPTILSLRGRRTLWLVIGAALIVRVVIAFATGTDTDDQQSFAIVRTALREDPLHFYQDVPDLRWPYPSGYLPLVAVYALVDSIAGLDYLKVLRLGPIAADVCIALLVQHMLGRRGASERTRLAAVALVVLGPVFIGVAAYQGQLDSVAILPAVAALAVWDRGGPSRALAAGLLIGLGASMKSVPLLTILALAPSARSWREAGTMVAAAVAVPVVLLAPWLMVDARAVYDHLTYRGFPGLGGLSLVVQPDFPLFWQADHLPPDGALIRFLIDSGGLVTAAGMVAVVAVLARFRPDPYAAATIVWLAVWLFGVNFFIQYLVWGLPFLLARGHLRAAAAIQLLAAPPLLMLYLEVDEEALIWTIYTAPMIALWLLIAFLLAREVRGLALSAREPRAAA